MLQFLPDKWFVKQPGKWALSGKASTVASAAAVAALAVALFPLQAGAQDQQKPLFMGPSGIQIAPGNNRPRDEDPPRVVPGRQPQVQVQQNQAPQTYRPEVNRPQQNDRRPIDGYGYGNNDGDRYRIEADNRRREDERRRQEAERQRQWHNNQNSRFQNNLPYYDSGYGPQYGSYYGYPGSGYRPQGVPPPRYYFRDDDNRWLRNYYRDDMRRVDRSRRLSLVVGMPMTSGYHRYMRPFSSDIYLQVQQPPPGYEIGYYDGYSVVYDPATGTVLSFIDLLD